MADPIHILITGGAGQVGLELLAAAWPEEVVLHAPTRAELDLGDAASVRAAFAATPFAAVVNSGAHTAVDKAETEVAAAFAANAMGPAVLADATREAGIPLIQVSTDYVFDGALDRPYVESDPTGPTGIYGASKLAGEQAVLDIHDNSVVLRVAWVYSPFGGNFVKTMLRLAAGREELGIVGDQVGNPTSALAIADGIIQVAANMVADSSPDLRGTFHMTAPGEASWADFAQAIFAASAARGGPSASVRSISTADYPTPATRPANSRLDCGKIARVHGVTLPDWHTSLDDVMDRLQPAKN